MEKKIIINIGRQFGGGGRGVAYELGRKLNIPVYDREIISQAAKDSGFGAEFFKERDEKRGFFSFTEIFANGFGGDTENYMSDRGIFKLQSQTIEKIAEQGMSLENARAKAQEKDKKRAEYYNYYTFGEWGVAGNYDLCIDSSILGIEGTADFIIDFARKAGKI